MSVDTRDRNVGPAAPPEVGPANTRFAFCVLKEKDSAGVVVAVATEVVNNGLRLPELKLVTVPVPAGRSPAWMVEETKSVPSPLK